MSKTENRIGRVIGAWEIENHSMILTNFYDKFRSPISSIRTYEEGECMLLALEGACESYSRFCPNERETICEIYNLLKRKCVEAMRELG